MLRWMEPLTFEHTAIYFERGDYILHNHHINGWVVVTPEEYHVVSALRRGVTPDQAAALLGDEGLDRPAARQLVGKVVMRLLMYRIAYQGERPATFNPVEEPRGTPGQVYFVCTNRCNLSCSYCYAESGPHRDTRNELTTDECLRLIDEIADLGVKIFTFTGGEALTRSDIFTLAARVKTHGMRLCLISNGASITSAKAEQIARYFDKVSVSLDSIHPEEHDFYRGHGSHEQAMRGLRLLREAGVDLQVNATATDKSAVHFVDLVDWTASENLDLKYSAVAQIGRGNDDFGIGIQENKALRTRLRNRSEELILQMALEQGESIPLPIRQLETRVHCGHGVNEFSIDPMGDVYPCRLFHQPDKLAGNVRQTPLREIWLHSPVFNNPAFATVDKMPTCSRCTFRKLCGGGCRAGAEGHTGDYYGVVNAECPSIRRDLRLQMWYYFRRDQVLDRARAQESISEQREVSGHAGD